MDARAGPLGAGDLCPSGPAAVGGAAGRPAASSLTVAGGIETLQWLLPLGRVVSPVDATLNALGAVVAGGAAALVLGHGRAGSPASQRVGAGA